MFGVVLGLGQAVATRHRAAGGADMAALAAADHWAEGTTAACAQADRVARAQGTRLTRCVVVGDVSDVSVESGTGPFTAEVRARAGPATLPTKDACNAPQRGAGLSHLRLRRVGAPSPHAPALTRPPTPAPPSAAP
ncbi:Rv3654c family TadE-like protein [Streptomyces hyaluromycini]|uniref:Rv3654c family TadE-like protein n=1 Tax=Streptomyces hyaluromycini TaxID=1377993 RepID=UPI003D9EDBEF